MCLLLSFFINFTSSQSQLRLKIIKMSISNFILVYLLTFNAVSQQLNYKSATNVSTIPYYEKNEYRTFHVTKTEERLEDEEKIDETPLLFKYDITFKIKNATDSNYTMEMTYKNFKINPEADNYIEAMRKITENLTILYYTDQFGQFDTIINSKELTNKMSIAFDAILKQEIAKVDSKDSLLIAIIEEEYKSTKELYLKPENIEILLLEDIGVIHALYGDELVLNKPKENKIQYILFNKKSINGTSSSLLTNINKAKNECKIEISEKPNTHELEVYMKDLMDLFFSEEVIENEKASNFKYNSSTKTIYFMDLTNGWIDQISLLTKIKTSFLKETVKISIKKEYSVF